MSTKKGLGIFGKVFLYTLLFLIFVIGITVGLFARQFMTAYDAGRKQQLMDIVQPLYAELDGKPIDDVIRIAESFHEKNTSIQFYIQVGGDTVIFETMPISKSVEAEQKDILPHAGNGNVVFNQLSYIFPISDDMVLHVLYASEASPLTEIITRTAVALSILLITTILGTFIFARGISNPIKKLANDTAKMSKLEFEPEPLRAGPSHSRGDEIGRLTDDVHKMYENLKSTISKLEIEIEREREMEENQRYFFSAASHELKTPLAAATAMLEGMIDKVVEVSEYPKYLTECLKMMASQSKLISEILEIVRLEDGRIQPDPQPLELLAAINSVIPSYQTLADTKGQHITVSVPNKLLCRIDANMFRRVISNIIMNAVQNTPDKGEIRIWNEERSDYVTRLYVLNTNTHIEDEIMSKLFEPFYRLDKARGISENRSGLGLTIVKKALETMEIPFSLENTKDGVLFWMDLPI